MDGLHGKANKSSTPQSRQTKKKRGGVGEGRGVNLHTSEKQVLHPEPLLLVSFLTTPHSHIIEEMTSTRTVCDFMEPEHSPEVLRLTFLITHTQREANHIKKKREKVTRVDQLRPLIQSLRDTISINHPEAYARLENTSPKKKNTQIKLDILNKIRQCISNQRVH